MTSPPYNPVHTHRMADPTEPSSSIPTRQLLDQPLKVCADTMLDSFGAYEAIRDDDGRIVDFEIVHFNAQAAADFGLPANEQIGRRLSDVFPAVWTTGYFERYVAVVTSGTPLLQHAVERYGRFWDMRVSRLGDGFVAVWRDVTEGKQTELRLRASEEQAQARAEELAVLLDATPAAVWIARDPECHDIRGSRFAHSILRMDDAANLSLTPAPNAPPAPSHFIVRNRGVVLEPHDLPMQRAARGEEIRGFEEEVVFDDGEQVWLYGTAIPIRHADGTPRGAIAAFVDITARKEFEHALQQLADARQLLLASEQQARAAAEEASLGKDRFLAMVSHELRTPLTAVLGYLQMLRNGTVPEVRQASVLDTIYRNAVAQMQLIDDILEVSGIVRGKLELDVQPASLDEILRNAVATLSPAAHAKQIRVDTHIDPGPATIRGDARRLLQVFCNVIANAVKFTPHGGSVDVALHTSSGGYEVSVRDSGVGIAPEFLPRIFEQFAQGENSSRRGGLGLGLSIAQHLILAHGGTISAESGGVNQGAVFRIELPRAEAASAVGSCAILQPG
jgi:signal transduction histidine kinase